MSQDTPVHDDETKVLICQDFTQSPFMWVNHAARFNPDVEEGKVEEGRGWDYLSHTQLPSVCFVDTSVNHMFVLQISRFNPDVEE